ncbi:hypothetical protein FHS94_000658 [Sphingomonas aerophila]|jgi:hypothetical protein|uniref:Uncharacterized protein n=1 Tax=Sphingomonas aerophila TaxID=1344948 RepID=A0A7W9BAV5_9SPHN|nr:hypothetical protein [Sphingomonas aerophila]
MLHLGFANKIDALSWVVVVALGLKVVATALVLFVDQGAHDRPGRERSCAG